MEVKEVKISSKVIKKYFVSQNYKYEKHQKYLILQAKQLFINVRLEAEDG